MTDEEVRELVLANRPIQSNENEFQVLSDEIPNSKLSALDYINRVLKENSPSQVFMS